jgi:hypothetical protein
MKSQIRIQTKNVRSKRRATMSLISSLSLKNYISMLCLFLQLGRKLLCLFYNIDNLNMLKANNMEFFSYVISRTRKLSNFFS